MGRVNDHIQIARVFGIPIRLHYSWLIVFGLIVWTLSTDYFPTQTPNLQPASYWVKGLMASLLLFASILLHELGHAMVGRRHGLRTRSITLFMFGGIAELEEEPRDGRAEFWMAAAGPAVSLVLAGLFAIAASVASVGSAGLAVARYLAFINVMLAAFNLVPAFPLDGGRLLRGALWGNLGKARATRIASGASSFFALLLIIGGVLSILQGEFLGGVWFILIGLFIKDASASSYLQVRFDETMRGAKVRDAMIESVATVPSSGTVAEAAREQFMRSGYGSYPVMRGAAVVGLLRLRDVLGLSPEERETTSVQGAMSPLGQGIVTDPDAALGTAVAQMVTTGSGSLLVVAESRLVGLLTMGAVMRRSKIRESLAG